MNIKIMGTDGPSTTRSFTTSSSSSFSTNVTTDALRSAVFSVAVTVVGACTVEATGTTEGTETGFSLGPGSLPPGILFPPLEAFETTGYKCVGNVTEVALGFKIPMGVVDPRGISCSTLPFSVTTVLFVSVAMVDGGWSFAMNAFVPAPVALTTASRVVSGRKDGSGEDLYAKENPRP